MADLMGDVLPMAIGAGVVVGTTETLLARRRRAAAAKKAARSRIPNRGRVRVKAKAAKPVVHRGVRGGRYIIKHGHRQYV